MCGILATSKLERPFSQQWLKSLRRRGPDEIGFWSDAHVQLGHTRLSIIGLDERSSQPMENETHVMAYNGEIYNFLELKQRVEAEGVKIRSGSDSEVLLHAWSLWGEKILRDLTGFWAFAIYDKRSHVLTLVRDQFGIKPLYYSVGDFGVVAATMIRTILELLPEKPELDYLALSEYVRYQFTFGDRTFMKSIKKVLPGHLVEIDLETHAVSARCYEDILAPRSGPLEPLSNAWLQKCRDLVAKCVVDSTISDTSFTTFCSGGIDSSLITRLAEPDIAYHCNYSDPECNETFFAKLVTDGTDTRLFTVNASEEFNLVEKLADIVNDFDELTIGSVILPLDDLLAQVKRRYKVILTGTGGDELFAGYVRFQLVLGECYQDSFKELFMKMKPLERTTDRFEFTHRKGNPHFYNFYEEGAETSFHDAFARCNADDGDLSAMLRFDRRYFLQGLLNIDDKMCGRHSLEGRPSFLHQDLVRFVQGLDPNCLFSESTLKAVLRKVAEPTLPRSVVYRTDKMGFTTPIGTFVNHSTHLIREQLTSSRFRDFYNLTKMNFTAESKFSREVFGLLMLDLWLNRYA